jgi:hypothetical protein
VHTTQLRRFADISTMRALCGNQVLGTNSHLHIHTLASCRGIYSVCRLAASILKVGHCLDPAVEYSNSLSLLIIAGIMFNTPCSRSPAILPTFVQLPSWSGSCVILNQGSDPALPQGDTLRLCYHSDPKIIPRVDVFPPICYCHDAIR